MDSDRFAGAVPPDRGHEAMVQSKPGPSQLNRRFVATISFLAVCRFSREYMTNHIGPSDLAIDTHTVYLMDSTDEDIRNGLIDRCGNWVSSEAGRVYSSTLLDSIAWGVWRGYERTWPLGFRWTSCSGAILTVEKLGGHADAYRVECNPPRGRVSCGFMRIFKDHQVSFQELEEQPIVEDWDVEPNWPEPALFRPRSEC